MERVGEEEEAWRGWEEVDERHVNAWRKEIVGKGWKNLDWWENVVEGAGVEGDVEDEEMLEVRLEEVEEEVLLERGRQKPRTMIQEQFCVTKAKRVAYKEWKEAMLAKIKELINDGHMERDDAEVDGQ